MSCFRRMRRPFFFCACAAPDLPYVSLLAFDVAAEGKPRPCRFSVLCFRQLAMLACKRGFSVFKWDSGLDNLDGLFFVLSGFKRTLSLQAEGAAAGEYSRNPPSYGRIWSS